jgi:hypothetical protein
MKTKRVLYFRGWFQLISLTFLQTEPYKIVQGSLCSAMSFMQHFESFICVCFNCNILNLYFPRYRQ